MFDVPLTNVMIPIPNKGSIVSFSFEQHSRREKPVNPLIYRLRTDIEWTDVVRSSIDDERKHLNGN